MKVVDTKGLKCPQPLIMAKKALRELKEGESFMLVTDNDTSLANLRRFLADNNTSFEVITQEGVHTLTITLTGTLNHLHEAEEYCDTEIAKPAAPGQDFIVVFGSETMGSGNDELGGILTRSFFTTMVESDSLPSAMLFYNSGVKLGLPDSLVADLFKQLEGKGVRMMLCGTCVNFFNIKNDLVAGTISNMYEMAGIMTAASKIIKP